MSAYEKLLAARSKDRLTSLTFISGIFEDFLEMHGDRRFADDPAIVCGVARLEGRPVTVIGIEKGTDTESRILRNFGYPKPEGYRKALRAMKQAEKFSRPVICFVDTAGAFCGAEAEERGQGQAIAENLYEMMGLRVPIVSVMIGEGGSGGALALAVSDRVLMLENAVYSVISPEGCASILWKDAKRVADAAECLKITAGDMLELGVVEEVIPEDCGTEELPARVKTAILSALSEIPADQTVMLKERYARFGKMGCEHLTEYEEISIDAIAERSE